jgi:stearoyl-CoA desaturase (delta-9 desaturase)
MAIAPDQTELLERQASSTTAVLDNDEIEVADESLWQKDCASAMSDAEQLSAQQKRLAAGPNVPVILWLVLLHGGALAAPFFFSWEALWVCLGLYWLTGSVGVCMGYHRLLTHGSFKVHKPTRWLLAFIGGLSGEGCALDLVANHRKHHAHSDHDGDPHSPHEGGLWAHMWWLAWSISGAEHEGHVNRWAPDLAKDRVMRWVGHLFLPSHIVCGLALLAIGQWMGGPYMAASMLTWGLFIRLIIVLHVTWFVNSWSHMWGYRTYETTDDSRNNWLVGLLAFGEGWHNNHHAYPRMAAQGHKWWEIDMTYWVILAMKWTGLAWDVVDYKKISDRNR